MFEKNYLRMKKLFCLLMIATLVPSLKTLAQQTFSDAEVDYSVQVDLPEGTSVNAAAFQNSKLEFYFKNYLFRSNMSLGNTTYTTIHNSRTNSAISLIDAGVQKYLIRLNAGDLAKEGARYKGMTFTEVPGTKTIAGYTCRKAIGKLKDGSSFIVYYDPDLVPENPGYSERFQGLKGLPLYFEATTSSGVKMIMTATRVNITQQASSLFDAPQSGYRELTYAELQSMRNQGK